MIYGCSQPRELWFIDFNHVVPVLCYARTNMAFQIHGSFCRYNIHVHVQLQCVHAHVHVHVHCMYIVTCCCIIFLHAVYMYMYMYMYVHTSDCT